MNTAWDVLQNPNKVKDMKALATLLLDELGIEKVHELGLMEKDDLMRIVACLKPAGAAVFKAALQI